MAGISSFGCLWFSHKTLNISGMYSAKFKFTDIGTMNFDIIPLILKRADTKNQNSSISHAATCGKPITQHILSRFKLQRSALNSTSWKNEMPHFPRQAAFAHFSLSCTLVWLFHNDSHLLLSSKIISLLPLYHHFSALFFVGTYGLFSLHFINGISGENFGFVMSTCKEQRYAAFDR
jgi:hypothetical protein